MADTKRFKIQTYYESYRKFKIKKKYVDLSEKITHHLFSRQKYNQAPL